MSQFVDESSTDHATTYRASYTRLTLSLDAGEAVRTEGDATVSTPATSAWRHRKVAR